MKRYLLFGWDTYYPLGGWNDYKGSFESVGGARENRLGDAGQVIDGLTFQVVAKFYYYKNDPVFIFPTPQVPKTQDLLASASE
jgi:hypothetical protein